MSKLLLALCAVLAMAQDRRIDVEGDALVEVAPDHAILRLNLVSHDRLLKRARAMHSSDVQSVLAVAARYQIASADIAQDFPEIETRSDGFAVRRTVEITLRNLGNFDALLFDLYDNAALTADQVEFLVKDLLKYREQAREMAVKAAEAKANLIVGTMKRRLGRVMHVDVESGGGSLKRGPGRGSDADPMRRAMQNIVVAGGSATSSSAGGLLKIPVTAKVRVAYEILD